MSRRLFRRMKNKNYRKHYQYLIIMFNRIKSSTLRGMATVVAAIVLFVSFSAAAAAQDRAGSVSGTVKDANGPVVGAAVLSKVEPPVRPQTSTVNSDSAILRPTM